MHHCQTTVNLFMRRGSSSAHFFREVCTYYDQSFDIKVAGSEGHVKLGLGWNGGLACVKVVKFFSFFIAQPCLIVLCNNNEGEGWV